MSVGPAGRLFESINADEDLVTLVALWERLVGLHTNVGVLAKAEARNTKKPQMVHGSGGLKGESKGKLTGKLAGVEFIRKNKSGFEGDDAAAKDDDTAADHDSDQEP